MQFPIALKPLVVLLFALWITVNAASQVVLTKYYDSSWITCPKEQAFYYTQFSKRSNDTAYDCVSYWINNGKVKARSVYADTTFTKGIGWQLRYYANGQTEDSIYFDANGSADNSYHFYDNGKLYVHNTKSKGNKEKTEAYDINGKRISGFIYQRPAEFPGGTSAWQAYLAKHCSTRLHASRKERIAHKIGDVIRSTVKVMFWVMKDGSVSLVKIQESSGDEAADADALKVVRKSPKWINAVLMNEPAVYGQVQTIIYELIYK